MRKSAAALYLLPILVAVDLGSKFWAIETLTSPTAPVPLIPGLSLRLAFNPVDFVSSAVKRTYIGDIRDPLPSCDR